MKTLESLKQTAEKTIVSFHIGRGGRFHNPGHRVFLGPKKISDFTEDLSIVYSNQDSVYKQIKGHSNLEAKYFEALDGDKDAISFFENRVKMPLGEAIYIQSANGNRVGLTVEEAETGIGRINIDNEYNTTYSCYLSDCEDHTLRLIADSSAFMWLSAGAQEYVKLMLEQVEC